MLIDLRHEIENHCSKCNKIKELPCNSCFFSSVDLGRLDLGSNYIYRRAYHYLKCIDIVGFQRAETFGTRLNIQRKASAK